MAAKSQGFILLPSKDLPKDMSFFVSLGFRRDKIYPADHPAVAVLSGHGLHIRLDKAATTPPATILILTDSPQSIAPDGKTELTAPNGSTIKILPESTALSIPPVQPVFAISRLESESSWVVGRAGMLYRDLVPSRFGGALIASHIHIPNGGQVPDMVHYHAVRFQLIFCFKGWVKVVYEDQGEPFELHPGDCVIQPPEIRHRVLESGDGLQVIEIGVPAEHMTTVDHDMQLPTSKRKREREFQGQKFCHHKASEATWSPWRVEGFEFCDTGVREATKGVASVIVACPLKDSKCTDSRTSHNFDIHFSFVLKGHVEVSTKGFGSHDLKEGDAFTVPSGMEYCLSKCSKDLELLEVCLPQVT